VERVAEGLWKVPDDLAERGRQYDAQRLGDVAVELKSHLPIERQARVIGATWLDQQLIGGGRGLGNWALAVIPSRPYSSEPISSKNRGWHSAAGSASSSRATCWARYAIGN
jgi:hypothetical protein